MISGNRQRAFTVVELLIVIVTIGILAAVSFVAYNGIQARAQDTKIRKAADMFGDALQIWMADHKGKFPLGGDASSTPIANGECANGSDGWAAPGAYPCTVGDVLLAAKLLPPDFFKNIPNNVVDGANNYNLMLYHCANNKYMVMYPLRSPSSSDTSQLNSEYTKCDPPYLSTYMASYGTNFPMRDLWGMRGGKVFE